MVNCCRDMWRKRSHVTAPLSAMTSKDVPFKWGPEEQKAFEEIKKVICKETLLAFPDFNKPFHVFTDASDTQLGAVIMQDGKPLAFYSRKLNSAQRRCTTGEQELLSIVETLKEFRNILLGHKVIVHTDHKNIIYGNLANDRIIRWRLLLEEFGPEHVHINGKDNVVADALSRYPMNDDDHSGQLSAHCMSILTRWEDEVDMETFVTTRDMEMEKFPMNPHLIRREQQKVKAITKNKEFKIIKVEDAELFAKDGRIVVPTSLQSRTIEWFHVYLAHPGASRMTATIGANFHWKNMKAHIHKHVRTCVQCQLCKKGKKNYGKLPPKKAEPPIPWNRVNVDLIGPYAVDTPTGRHELRAMTMIDPATGWFEIKEIAAPSSDCCQKALDTTWLSRHPRPQFIGFDGGSEFKSVFLEMCKNHGIKPKLSTPRNPQSNGIVERIHQVLGDAFRTFQLQQEKLDEKDPWSSFLAAAAFAVRSTVHTTLQATPGQLVFGRDMILPFQFKADWAMIHQRRQNLMDKANLQENENRVPHVYRVGDLVTKDISDKRAPKLNALREGPFVVQQVNANGTLRIQKGAKTELVNMRRIKPFHQD